MKIYLIFFFFLNIFINAQNTFAEKVGERVFLNKRLISYSILSTKLENGIEKKYDNAPNEKNPYIIFLSSDENKSAIRINNKDLREDTFIEFTKIYKMRWDENKNFYEFIGNKNCSLIIFVPIRGNDNQNVILKCGNDKNYTELFFVISKYDQL